MAKLKRYRCSGIDGMEQDNQGNWVRYEDYFQLLQTLDQIRIDLVQQKSAIYRDQTKEQL